MSIPFPGSKCFVEGSTILLVPSGALEARIPKRNPAFFNPAGAVSRDISVIICKAEASLSGGRLGYADSFAGVGSRGIRVAKEVDGVDLVVLNDLNPKALEFAKASAKLNEISHKCRFECLEASRFLVAHSSPLERLPFVDVDPYGSPASCIEPGLRAVKNGGVLSLTATDMPALCGIYPNVAFRHYGGFSLRTEYSHEIGLRLIIGAAVFSAMRLNLGVEPLFCHSVKHYLRVYLRVLAGVKHSEESRNRLGFIEHCKMCGSRSTTDVLQRTCSLCRSKTAYAGPLWVGSLFKRDFLRGALEMPLELPERYRKLFSAAENEADLLPTFYLPDQIADKLDIQAPSPGGVIKKLQAIGIEASRTSLNPKGIRCNAPLELVTEAVASAGKKN